MKILFFTICLLSFWALNCFADRLYMWEDSSGVEHISKEPPPKDAKQVGVMDYKNHTVPPRDQKQTDQKQVNNPNQNDADEAEKSVETINSTDDVVDYEYNDGIGDPYTREVRREDRREERQDNIADRQADDDASIRENMEENREERHDFEEPIRDNVEHRSGSLRK